MTWIALLIYLEITWVFEVVVFVFEHISNPSETPLTPPLKWILNLTIFHRFMECFSPSCVISQLDCGTGLLICFPPSSSGPCCPHSDQSSSSQTGFPSLSTTGVLNWIVLSRGMCSSISASYHEMPVLFCPTVTSNTVFQTLPHVLWGTKSILWRTTL